MSQAKGGRPVPASPDSLETGIRGRITGVTRIGPRALGAGALTLFLVIALIVVGANKQQARRTADAAAVHYPAPAPADTGHFGADEPIAVTPASLPAKASAPSGGDSVGPPIPAGLVLTTPTPIAAPPPAAAAANANVPDLQTAQTQAAPAMPAPQPTIDVAAQARAQRLAAEHQRRAQAEAARAAELQAAQEAPVLVGETQSPPPPAAAPPPVAGSDAAATPAPLETGNAFLSGPFGQYAKRTSLAQGGTANAADYLDAQRYAPRGRYEIVASSVIPAELITGIDSEQPGLISATVRQDVYDSRTGRYLLIPKGSRLIGVYKSDVQTGQTRLLVAWERLIFPDTSSIDLHEQAGADTEGYAGLAGKVDTHVAAAFGAAALSSIISAGLQLSQPKLNMTTAGIAVPSTGQIAAGAIGQQVAQIGGQLVQKQLGAPPTIHVPRGYPFVVVVDRDMVLPGPYGSGSDSD